MARIGLLTLGLILAFGLERSAAAQDAADASKPGASKSSTSAIPTAPAAADRERPGDEPAAPKGEAAAGAGISKDSILQIFGRLNPMLWVLGLCSIVTIGFSLERLVALRKARVIPRDFVDRFMDRLSTGKLDRDRAMELCRANDSTAARVFAHAVRYWGMPAVTIRQAVEQDAAGEVLELKRNVRVLNGCSTLAPLLGLLGTVIGMIESFDALDQVSTGKSEALAHGISLALVSTGVGLGIAVVAVVMYYFLLNRVDILVKAIDDQTRRVVELVSSEAIRPTTDRRGGLAGDHSRHDSRIHG
ncbi:MAG: MotA/TolQ/ExbB proton channel family protein [Isosphaeraceae bacterium]|nr:MotA/TolQ/ExbB proton channel family protein [Isosphaeraceae bacterium]